MITFLAAMVLAAVPIRPETTIVLGSIERDLTGDGTPELLRLVGRGRTIDSLDVTLTIESDGRTVYRQAFAPLTRRIGFDGDRRVRSAARQRDFVRNFGKSVFEPRSFRSAAAFFVAWKSASPRRAAEIPENIARDGGFYPDTVRGRAIWADMESQPITIFRFSPGGDGIVELGWSAREHRFFNLISCC